MLALANCLAGAQTAAWDTMPDTWVATDALGREIASASVAGGLKPGKVLCMFYYLWHDNHPTGTDSKRRVLNIPVLMDENPELKAAPWTSKIWDELGSRPGAFHYGGEPLFGYYSNKKPEEWVLRKHCQLLADAGVDVIVIDVTNGFTYDDAVTTLLELYTRIRAEGGRSPQVAFITWSGSGHTAQRLYDAIYAKGLYKPLWFQWQGKPLIFGKPEEMSPVLTNFFTIRTSWAWPGKPTTNYWSWIDTYPQNAGLGPQGQVEQLSIATASHPTSNKGKSFREGKPYEKWPGPYPTDEGRFFAQQFSRVSQVDPTFLFVTQWNEWVAQRQMNQSKGGIHFLGHALQPGETFFVDVFDGEFNRDIEPRKGGWSDNYYWQFVDYARRFKGVRSLPEPSGPVSIKLGDFSAWNTVEPVFRDDLGDVVRRDGWGPNQINHYVNNTGRNDFKLARVARDRSNVWFYIQTVAPITPRAGTNWMNLFIGLDGARTNTWQRFQYLVQPSDDSPDAPLMLRRYAGDGTNWAWSKGVGVQFKLLNDVLVVQIPRAELGLEPQSVDLDLRFKWADNMQSADPIDWLVNGDTAPNARFAYHYRTK